MADRNLSVMAFMFLMEASSLVLTSSWDIACSGVTSYGSLLLRTGQKEKENMRHINADQNLRVCQVLSESPLNYLNLGSH